MDPQLQFSQWSRHSEWAALGGLGLPGIYMIARFDREAPKTVEAACGQVIYIGETCVRTLRQRLREFTRAAQDGVSKHSGGRRFHALIGEEFRRGFDDSIYVSVLAIEMREPDSSAYIRYLERLFIWEFVAANGSLPVCNGK